MKPRSAAVTQAFTEEQVRARDYRLFVHRFNRVNMSEADLREHFDSVAITVEGFESDPLAMCERAEIRQFFQALHQEWPDGFYFLNASEDHLRAYVCCLLSVVTVRRLVGRKTSVLGYRRNELFQLVVRGIDQQEKVFEIARKTQDDFRTRSRQLLRYFGFLKG